mgnify:CR=1 FL=1
MQDINEKIDSEAKNRLTSETIRFALIVLAFITPYALWIGLGPSYSIRLIAPLWSFSSMGYPIFVIWSLDNLITELLFGLIRLAFIRQVLLYKKQLTTPTTLVLTGILCELPGPVLPYVALLRGWVFFPFPLFLLVGLLPARYCSKEPLSWPEVEEN